jgi:polysaccharide export outer membrane protein
VSGVQKTFEIRIDDLIKNGEIEENIDMLPGDIIIIPEAWF